jgi:polyphenol oxidase
MKLHREGNTEYLTFEILNGSYKLRHAIFLRGDDDTPFDVSDGAENFDENIKTIAKVMGVNTKHVRWAHQVHGNHVIDITDPVFDIPACDALVTSEKNLSLMIRHADCQTALFYDPVNEVIANVHAGWRGNVLNIYHSTVEFLVKKYGSDVKNLLVGVGPSIGPEHAEFINYKEEFPSHLWHFRDSNNHFNLWDIAEMQLRECGIPAENIEIARIDTYGDEKNYYSYRRDKTQSRHATVITLK